MNAHSSACFDASCPVLGGFIGTLRSVFQRPDPGVNALAASLASELSVRPEVRDWVVSLSAIPARERSDSLRRTASSFRGQWQTLGVADALKRIASKPALFVAVARELQMAHGVHAS